MGGTTEEQPLMTSTDLKPWQNVDRNRLEALPSFRFEPRSVQSEIFPSLEALLRAGPLKSSLQ